MLLAPIIKDKKEHIKYFLELTKKGFVRVRVDGEILYVEDEISLDKIKAYD